MTTKRQLRVELADAQTTISALRATVVVASVSLASWDGVGERVESVASLGELAAHIGHLGDGAVERERVALHEKRTAFWHGTAQHQKRRAEAMTRVGDRMAANANAQTRKEWEAAKEGRPLRGPDGRRLKAEGPPP